MNNKQQILHIHGGMAFNSPEDYLRTLRDELEFDINEGEKPKSWRHNYLEFLDEKEYQIIKPTMPSKDNAYYEAWKIWFEKVIPHLDDDLIIVGHSLGGLFLAKYLSENAFPVSIKQLHLVAAVYDYEDEIEQLGDFRLQNFPGKLLDMNIPEIHIYHSTDDTIVPVEEANKYHKALQGSHLHIFDNRFHFIGETFPELFENIK